VRSEGFNILKAQREKEQAKEKAIEYGTEGPETEAGKPKNYFEFGLTDAEQTKFMKQ